MTLITTYAPALTGTSPHGLHRVASTFVSGSLMLAICLRLQAQRCHGRGCRQQRQQQWRWRQQQQLQPQTQTQQLNLRLERRQEAHARRAVELAKRLLDSAYTEGIHVRIGSCAFAYPGACNYSELACRLAQRRNELQQFTRVQAPGGGCAVSGGVRGVTYVATGSFAEPNESDIIIRVRSDIVPSTVMQRHAVPLVPH